MEEWTTVVGEEELAPTDLVEGSMYDVARAIEDERIGQYPFRGLARAKPVKVARALRQLAEHGKWPAMYWEPFLWTVADDPEASAARRRLQRHVARVLGEAPEELYRGIGSAAADFVKELANRYGTDEEPEIETLWTKAWAGGRAEGDGDDHGHG